MEFLLSSIAKKIINIIDPQKQYIELERLQMYFGLQTTIYNIVVTTVILLIALTINTFFETLLLFAVFGILRIIAGGYHFNSMTKCVTITTIIIVTGGKCIQSVHISLPICILICIFADIIFFSHTPTGTYKNPYTRDYSILQRKRLRILTVILTIFAILSNTMIRSVIVFSMTIVALLLFPNHRHKSPIVE